MKQQSIFAALLIGLASLCQAINVPNDPSQSIRYWKPQVIAPESDPRVQLTHSLFSHLLGAWDISRVEPSLNVVQDASGPWAASLADGNILLSRKAIDICLNFGKERGEHLLAFILAHELAHQKGNDLWHQQFFRLIGNQSPERTEEIRRDLALDDASVSQLESIEAQADLDAVVMMASVGYDPYQIVKDNDFYTAWIENIWRRPCTDKISACKTAKERALRTHAQLESISDQAIFYELGIQNLVAKNYEQARAYLTTYARNFPGRSVHNSIGVSYLAEAITLWPEYAQQTSKPDLYFPLFVEAQPAWRTKSTGDKRGSPAQLKASINVLAEKALNYFEKAQRLSPEHKQTHYLRALSFLLMENSPMAKGIIEGQYIPSFGSDESSDLLRGLSLAIEGKYDAAEKSLRNSAKRIDVNPTAEQYALLYALTHNRGNLVKFTRGENAEKTIWKNFAHVMSQQKQGYLLQLSLSKLKGKNTSRQETKKLKYNTLAINHKTVGAAAAKKIWFEGEPLNIHRDDNGVWLTDEKNTVIALWLHDADFEGIERLSLGDAAERIIRVMGPADRQINLTSGEYLAYDNHGLALRVNHNKLDSWFLYEPGQTQ